jgi:hypothetical protein
MYDDESFGAYIIHVQCLSSCREQTRNKESNPIASSVVSAKHIAAYSPAGRCHTSDKRAIRFVLHSDKGKEEGQIESFIGSSGSEAMMIQEGKKWPITKTRPIEWLLVLRYLRVAFIFLDTLSLNMT